MHGIFNKTTVQTASLLHKVSVLHVCSDENIKSKFECVESTEDNIYTLIVYYKKVKINFPFISHLMKIILIIKAFNLGYKRLTSKLPKPNLIHLNVIMPSGIGAYYLSNKYHIPYIISEHWTGYTPEDSSYTGIFEKFFTKKIVANAQLIMPVSEHLKESMLSHNLNCNYKVLSNVVNTDLFKPNYFNKDNSITKFIHISTLDENQKNVSGIIKSFYNATLSNTNIKLTIVGDIKNAKNLLDLTEELNLSSKINFTGKLIGQKLVDELNQNDVFVLFSNYENLPLVILESFACGKPVITTLVGGISEIMNNNLGLVVEKMNDDSLTKQMLNYCEIKNNFDADYIRNYAVTNFSKEVISKKLNVIYNSIISKSC